MKCQKCKEQEANVKITQIINDNKIEMYLCDECAKAINVPNIKFDIDNFFSGFFNSWPMLSQKEIIGERKCNTCGYTFEDFVKYGQLGCPHCYDTFSDNLDYVFEKMHGKTRHVGKGAKVDLADKKIVKSFSLKESKIQNQIIEKEEMLRKCINEEKYEEAAKYRDEIKKLKDDLMKINKKEE